VNTFHLLHGAEKRTRVKTWDCGVSSKGHAVIVSDAKPGFYHIPLLVQVDRGPRLDRAQGAADWSSIHVQPIPFVVQDSGTYNYVLGKPFQAHRRLLAVARKRRARAALDGHRALCPSNAALAPLCAQRTGWQYEERCIGTG